MTVWRGGRGVKAPYESTHVRVPMPVKDRVEDLIKAYKDGRMDEKKELPPVEEVVEIARDILKKRKSAKVSVESLLTAIYGKDVCL